MCCRHRYSTSSTARHWPLRALLVLDKRYDDADGGRGFAVRCRNSVHCWAVSSWMARIRLPISLAILCEATQLIVSSKSCDKKSSDSAMMQSHCTTGSFARSSIAQTQEQRRMELVMTLMRSVTERMSLKFSSWFFNCSMSSSMTPKLGQLRRLALLSNFFTKTIVLKLIKHLSTDTVFNRTYRKCVYRWEWRLSCAVSRYNSCWHRK